MLYPTVTLEVKAARSLYDFDRDTDNPHQPVKPSWDDATAAERIPYFQRARVLFRDIGPYIKARKP